MRARDVMTTRVVTVGEETRVEDIARLLLEHRISAVPVVDAHRRLVGIVSEGDLMRRAQTEAARPSSLWLRLAALPREASLYLHAHGRVASDLMTRKVITVDEAAPLAEIVDLLERHRIKRVPVIHHGKVVGIVSRSDLLRRLATARAVLPPSKVDDRTLRRTLLATMTGEADIDPLFLNVRVEDGIAHLWGLVDSDAERRAARLVAENTPGIRAIDDRLGVMPPHAGSMRWT